MGVNRHTARIIFIMLLLLAIIGVGLVLAAKNTDLETFLTNAGFLLSGTALGVALAIWLIPAILNQRQRRLEQEVRRKLLRSIGHDSVGAISRVFSGPPFSPFPGLTYDGVELNRAWYYRVETGRKSPEGFKSEIYDQYQKKVYSDAERQAKSPPPPRTILTNSFMDFDIGLLMVTRALGRAYARFDLFDAEELPINALESAAAILRDGKAKGHLDSFQAASLMSALGDAVETCGMLLWRFDGFVKRAEPELRHQFPKSGNTSEQ